MHKDRKPDYIRVGGDELAFHLTTAQSGGRAIAYDVRMAAGGGPPMLHRHPSFEIYRVTEGELAVYVEQAGDVRRSVLRRGGVIAIPGGREHTIRNESGGEARAYAVLAPGDELERFARAAASATSPADVPAIAEAHGIEITRPLPAADRLRPLAERWATLLKTRRRDGSWVATPVNLAVDGGRAYFGTPATTGKVKRLRNFDEVELAPCTPRGKPTGPAVAGRARRLEGAEADPAARALARRHPFVYRVAAPLEHQLKRTHGVFYEVTPA